MSVPATADQAADMSSPDWATWPPWIPPRWLPRPVPLENRIRLETCGSSNVRRRARIR